MLKMEKDPILHKPEFVPHSAHRRPLSEKESPFRRLPAVSDSKNCIWITQDILNEFRAQVDRSHTVTLKFNNIDERARELDSGRRRFPPIVPDRTRMMHSRSTTNYELKEPTSYNYRPVKVYVEDLAKTRGAASYVPEVHTRSRDANRKQSSIVSKTHNRSSKSKRRCIDPKNFEFSHTRSMDSGEDGGELPDDIIETVAKANTATTDYPAHILPEIRAAPCPIHTKRDKPRAQEGALATNSFLNVKTPRRFQQPHPVTNITVQQNNPSQTDADKPVAHRRGNKLDINVKIPHQYPLTQPSLPKNMSSKDYVMTWLIHGSAPQGANHFPDIVHNNHVKTKTKKTHRRAELSE